MKYRPISNRIIVEIGVDTKSEGGIIFSTKSKKKQQFGTVLAVGPGIQEDHGFVENTLKIGDVVIFPPFTGNKLSDGNWIMRESEVLGVLS